ncbi:translocation protein TolB [Pirellulimonas nuda]|uniref:Translocation protein TolB n=1 Tax=Pirellulimonas nuda TaxID=2528009 RepID=A0A518DHI7_9BACT|nr:DUF3748 domain-containing protein [Pirellulimonas nuda]QDU90940.1 translocation protein TolB [Pirellulimonas nuda]
MYTQTYRATAPQAGGALAHVSLALLALGLAPTTSRVEAETVQTERQITTAPGNHLLTNTGVWSPDGEWIYYDMRSDAAGSVFDGQRIERVRVATGEVEVVFVSRAGACCGVVTASPVDDRVVFIHGPENPTDDWSYTAWHRRGVVVHADGGAPAATLDARDITPPFTPGALRGGTHVHVFSGDGHWVSFTYEDHVLASADDPHAEKHQRNVGVAAPLGHVSPPKSHPRNHDGIAFCVLVTETVDSPRPGTDQINRAYSDAWVGAHGYVRPDGTRQARALAFLGDVASPDGSPVAELFVVDIPNDVTKPGARPLEGTATTWPAPPLDASQRRLTFTTSRSFPGLGPVRHWPRSSPDGDRIAFLMRDRSSVEQLWLISPNGGEPTQLTHNAFPIESAFTWRADGGAIACVAGGSVCEVDTTTGETTRLTGPRESAGPPRPEACVYSPDGRRIAYVREVANGAGVANQVFVATTRPDGAQKLP